MTQPKLKLARSLEDAEIQNPKTRIILFSHFAIDRNNKVEYYLSDGVNTVTQGFDDEGLSILSLTARFSPRNKGKKLFNNGFPIYDSETGIPLSYEGRIGVVPTEYGLARPLNIRELNKVDYHSSNLQLSFSA